MNITCRIIGVLDNGVDGLTAEALAHLQTAEVIIGGTRVLQLFADYFRPDSEQFDLTGQLSSVPEWIKKARAAEKNCVVLATGDPLCHGIANFLIKKLGADTVTVLPNVSTLQLACARLGLAWQAVRIGSVHSGNSGDWFIGAESSHSLYALLQLVQQSVLTAVLTSPDNTPQRIARMLTLEGLADDFDMVVAECLLQENEKVSTWLSVHEVENLIFDNPNVVVLQRKSAVNKDAVFGLPDDRFQQRKPDKGLITKREVRAVSLARLALQTDSIVWDIGAGSGSVGLEAARLCPHGHVYAIEKNADDYAIALANRASLKVTNYTLLHGRAPVGLENWANPDAVFIGGSGGELRELITLCLQRLNAGGQLVMNFATLENLATAVETLKNLGADWDVVQLQAARSKPILDMHRMQAENPIWLVCAEKSTQE